MQGLMATHYGCLGRVGLVSVFLFKYQTSNAHLYVYQTSHVLWTHSSVEFTDCSEADKKAFLYKCRYIYCSICFHSAGMHSCQGQHGCQTYTTCFWSKVYFGLTCWRHTSCILGVNSYNNKKISAICVNISWNCLRAYTLSALQSSGLHWKW